MVNIKPVVFLAAALFAFALLLTGCSSGGAGSNSALPTENARLVIEKTISPNEAYAASQEDVVYYTVEVWQEEEGTIVVRASSNAAFFDDMQYALPYVEQLEEGDVDVLWTTAMGNPNGSEDDQLAIATVSVSHNGTLLSERKINFMNKALDIVAGILERH